MIVLCGRVRKTQAVMTNLVQTNAARIRTSMYRLRNDYFPILDRFEDQNGFKKQVYQYLRRQDSQKGKRNYQDMGEFDLAKIIFD